jgi:hypothetical protein
MTIEVQYQPRDAWVGLYWDVQTSSSWRRLQLYLCAVPFLPIKLTLLVQR